MKELPRFAKTQLVRHLGALEGIWAPLRNNVAAAAAFYARQQSRGLPRLGGGSGSKRTRSSYWVAELTKRGLMTSHGLTPKGKRLARSWVWPYSPQELKRAARRLLAAIKRRDVLRSDGATWVPDALVCGTYWSAQQALLQRLFLPWLTDGVLLSGTDTARCVFYSVADPKVDLIRLADRVVDLKVSVDDELREAYEAEFSRVRNEAIGDTASYSEIGYVPLPLVELESGRDDTRPGMAPLFPDEDAKEIEATRTDSIFAHLEKHAHLLEDEGDG